MEEKQMKLVVQGVCQINVNQKNVKSNVKNQIKQIVNCGINLCNGCDRKSNKSKGFKRRIRMEMAT